MCIASEQTSRQKLPKDWHRKMQGIQLKAGEAAQSLPARLKSEDESSAVGYLLAKHIRQTLAESSERNLFGALTGPASVWDKIVRAYEKESECALRPMFFSLHFMNCASGLAQAHVDLLSCRHLPGRVLPDVGTKCGL